MSDRVYKIILSIILSLSVICLYWTAYVFGVIQYSKREHLDLEPYIDNDYWRLYNFAYNYYLGNKEESLTNEEIKEKVRTVVSPSFFTEQTTDKLSMKGDTNLIIRKIRIASDLIGKYYCYILTHEYCHLYYMLSDERLTDYKTVILLWESDDEYLKWCASYIIMYKLSINNGDKYDCTAQLINYFIKN